MSCPDDEWIPPSEAQLKVISARRERSDKISKLMGEYMLKGYKMLATTCTICDTIELQVRTEDLLIHRLFVVRTSHILVHFQDRSGKLYCVACQEVDSAENAKDDPARTRSRERTREETEDDDQDGLVTVRSSIVLGGGNRLGNREAPSTGPTGGTSVRPVTPAGAAPTPLASLARTSAAAAGSDGSGLQAEVSASLDAVTREMQSARRRLEAGGSMMRPAEAKELVELIGSCAACLKHLQSLN